MGTAPWVRDCPRWLEQSTDAIIQVEEGSLYPALYRMEKRGLIDSDWEMTELGRPAKFYKLTADGRKQLKQESAEWLAFAKAVTLVLEPAT